MYTGILEGIAMFDQNQVGTFGGVIIVVSDGLDSSLSANAVINKVSKCMIGKK